jgi:16S rRNA (guanine966-N2)-methyltransferase
MYLGDRATRPMKDSIRETLFNILGRSIKGSVALDLFAGTGVLAIESLSRGAVQAVAIEKSGYAAKNIRSSADNIGIGGELSVLTGDSFRIAPARMREIRESTETISPHWVVYFCPPYAMWVDCPEVLFELLRTTADLAPVGSQIVAETDKFFDVTSLPFEDWDIRRKGNVTLSFWEKKL